MQSTKHVRRDGDDEEHEPHGRGRALDIGGQLDVARCPRCDGPMTPRLNRRGSYFYCRCYARKDSAPEAPLSAADSLPIPCPAAAFADDCRVDVAAEAALPFPSCNNNLSSVG